jgi:hypothetical protein
MMLAPDRHGHGFYGAHGALAERADDLDSGVHFLLLG